MVLNRRIGGAWIYMALFLLSGCAAIRSHHAFLRGVELYGRGNYEGAERRFRQVMDDSADAVQAKLYRGWCAFFRNDPGEAEQLFRRVLGCPDRSAAAAADAWHGLGRTAFLRKAYKTAADHARRSLEINPDETGPRLLLGWSLLRLGNFEEAESVFRAVLMKNPSLNEARLGLGWTQYDLGEPDTALLTANRVLKQAPDNTSALELKGRCLLALKQYRAARTCFEKLLERNPGNRTAIDNIAFLDTLQR